MPSSSPEAIFGPGGHQACGVGRFFCPRMHGDAGLDRLSLSSGFTERLTAESFVFCLLCFLQWLFFEQTTAWEESFERAAPMRNFLNGTAPIHPAAVAVGLRGGLGAGSDRLRKHSQFVQHEVRGSLKRIQTLCADAVGVGKASPPLAEIDNTVKQLAAVLRDLQDRPVTIRLTTKWSHRRASAGGAGISLAAAAGRRDGRGASIHLENEYVEWFPARLRHILDNLLSNALKYRDPSKTEAWVHLGLRVSSEGLVPDIGQRPGLAAGRERQMFELFYRAAPARAAGLGVGLAVVKLLVEQSGGTLTSIRVKARVAPLWWSCRVMT